MGITDGKIGLTPEKGHFTTWHSGKTGYPPILFVLADILFSGENENAGKGKTMQIVICDDEKEIRDWFSEKIRRFCPEADVMCCASGEELLAGETAPDLLFLDIRLPEMDGMETARKLREKYGKMILIFITALEEYVFQAFDVGAFHYLVKPVSEEKLKEVLGRATGQHREAAGRKPVWEEKSIVIKSGGVSNKIRLAHVVYAEVYNRKVVIHKTDGDVEYYGRLGALEKMAGEDFFRSHRGYLVHFKYVEKYDASMIWLKGGTALMAKQKYPEFVRKYLNYHRNKGGSGVV